MIERANCSDPSFDGNDSLSSLMTVDSGLAKSKEPTSQTKQCSHTRRVRFDESQNTMKHQHHRATTDCWWSNAEYSAMKKNATQALLKLRQNVKVSLALKSCYAALVILEKERKPDNVSNAIMDKKKFQLIQLYSAPTISLDLLGLESYVCNCVTSSMAQRRGFLQDQVYKIQQEVNPMLDDANEVAEDIKDSCCRVTAAPRTFAQLLAHAQMVATQL